MNGSYAVGNRAARTGILASVATGLKLEPTTTNTKAIVSLVVAESGASMFACAGRYSGLPDGPTDSGTVCGFAPVPT